MDKLHLQHIQDVLDAATSEKKVAGVNLMIYKDDVFQGYFQSGYADIENQKPFSKDTICRMYSMTKTVTSVAAMILLEEGRLDLGEELWRYIPDFKELTVCDEAGKGRAGKVRKAARPVLIQDLMNMTSGYTYGAWWDGAPLGEHLTSDLLSELNEDVKNDCKISTMEVAKRLARIPVSFEPGTGYTYGLSADIMGAVIETVSGMSFGDFLKKRIFEPLGMQDTDFYVPPEKQHRLAKVYICNESFSEGGCVSRELELFENPHLGIQNKMTKKPAFESGGAGLCSTVEDYSRFVCMLTNGGELAGHRILHKKTVDFLSTASLRAEVQQKFDQNMEHLCGYTYCNFMRVAKEPEKCRTLTARGEFGWDGWLGPYLSVDMQNRLAIVLTMQMTGAGTTDTARKVKNIIYSAL